MTKEEKKQEQLNWVLNEEIGIKLLRREVIAIYNILASLQYKLGDAEIVLKIFEKLKPYAAVDTNMTKQAHGKQGEETETIVLGKKELPN